jgi:HK97 family phage prohead protease/HK97 family phage major capsid protein
MQHLTFSAPIEAADGQRRIVSGQIVPFGAIGNTSAGHVIFERGSIQIPSAAKIKLLAQHNTNDPIGRAQSFSETATGINGVFKLSAASKAQDYLVMASEGLIDGLSVGVEVLASRERKDGVIIVSSAVLKEVSLVESPAFTDARVLDVVAQEGEETAVEETLPEDSAPIEVTEETPITESEATVSEDTTAATTEAAAAAEASRPIIKAAAPYTSAPRHDIISMGKYVEHKVKAALGDDTSRQYVAAAEDPATVRAAADSMSTNPAFNPIQYLSNFVSNTNFGRPTIDAVSRGTLPASGLTLNIPSLVTSAGGGSSVAPTVAETAESGAPSDTGMTSAYESVTIKKYAGQQTISLELLERSDPIFFDQLAIQLERAYKQATDSAMIAILTAQGTQATGVAATNAGLISYVSTEAPAAYKGSSYFADRIVANTDWWGTIMGYTDTTGRPIYNAQSPYNAAGVSTPTSIKGNVLGLDLYVDKNVTSGLVDESAFIIAPETAYWWESPEAFFSVNVVNSMSVQTAIYGYGAGKVLIPAGVRRFNLA